jgi:hypothetical protein
MSCGGQASPCTWTSALVAGQHGCPCTFHAMNSGGMLAEGMSLLLGFGDMMELSAIVCHCVLARCRSWRLRTMMAVPLQQVLPIPGLDVAHILGLFWKCHDKAAM